MHLDVGSRHHLSIYKRLWLATIPQKLSHPIFEVREPHFPWPCLPDNCHRAISTNYQLKGPHSNCLRPMFDTVLGLIRMSYLIYLRGVVGKTYGPVLPTPTVLDYTLEIWALGETA